MQEELLTVQELTQRLKISRRQLERLRHEGLPYIMIKSSPRFEFIEVLQWLKQVSASEMDEDFEFK